MSLTKLAAASLALIAVSGFALHIGCSSEPEPECTRNSNCTSATTPCTIGVCQDGKCQAQPVTDGTRVADQTPVKDKYCVKLECRAGKPTEAPDNSKTPPEVPCQKQVCENMQAKPEQVMDGVPCASSMGTCQAGVCVLNDSGPIGPKDGSGDTDTTEVGDDAADAESDTATTD